jgi:hypothetical protein
MIILGRIKQFVALNMSLLNIYNKKYEKGDEKAHFVCSVFGTLIMSGVANYVIFLTTLYDIIFQ